MEHTESWKRVTGVAIEQGDEGFAWILVSVVTTGNVRKVVRIPHLYADGLRTQIDGRLDELPPEVRRSSWQRCINWMRGSKK